MTHALTREQLELFLSPAATDTEKIGYLSTCPWLQGQYKNKLWRHSLHALSSYPSKLRPQIASFFIEYLSKPGDIVLDPMAGSGTVPLQACLTGRKGIGIDLSPYAFLLIRTKVQPPALADILERIDEVGEKVRSRVQANVPEEVKQFFHSRTLREILAIRSALDLSDYRDTAILALLCGILHGGRPGFLSRRTRDIIPIRPAGTFEYRPVIPRLRAKALRVYSHALPPAVERGEAYLGDCRNPNILPHYCADFVLTSPPFFEHTEFVRHNWLRLWLFGWSLEEQKQHAARFIGEKAANLHRFRKDINEAIANIGRWLRPGAYCVVHGGKKRSGEDMSELVIDAARSSDFAAVAIIDENADHTRKHAIRKISGESHEFVILRKLS